MKFEKIYMNSEKRLEECLLSLWAKGQHPMRPAIKELFKREPFIAEPSFQSSFGWKQIGSTTDWKALFDPAVAQMMEDIGTRNGTRAWAPYQHQYDSWEILLGNTQGPAQSIVVTSGTGSGKTECFLYPVFNDMYRHRGEGIQAVFMYPLNALAADQKDRIRKCCDALGLKFACYNGNLKETGRTPVGDSEIVSREDVRSSRPDLLMTNPSMLEYIMVRDADRDVTKPNDPAQEESSLRWIVIDEAHTYTGSSAVELRYEISRVLDAFNAKRDKVHFACTSATIGADQNQLRQFISELTGQDANLIHIIGGERVVPAWTRDEVSAEMTARGFGYDPDAVLRLQSEINQNPYLSTRNVAQILFPDMLFMASDTTKVLRAMDELCSVYRQDASGRKEFLMMARAHFFMREPNGLYACANPDCPEHGQSPMGAITTFNNTNCPHCGAPLLELVQCRNCGEFLYTALLDVNTKEVKAYRDKSNDTIDNIFADESSVDQQNVHDAIQMGNMIVYKAGLNDQQRLPSAPYLQPFYHSTAYAAPTLARIDHGVGAANASFVTLKTPAGSDCCTGCGQTASHNMVAPFRLSMDALKQVVTPALLAESTPNPGQYWGKFISFTDSRQKTAISAKRFNIGIEREYAMASILKRLSQDRAMRGGIVPMPLQDIRGIVASRDIFEHITRDKTNPQVWASYQAAVMRQAVGRRLIHGAGSLEAMGIVTVSYPTVNGYPISQTLNNWSIANNAGFTAADWHDFLKICLDFCVRMGNCIQPLDRMNYEYEKDYIRDNKPTLISNPDNGRGKGWPSVTLDKRGKAEEVQDRIILLLCAALGIKCSADLDVTANKDLVNGILQDAWDQLTDANTGVLTMEPTTGAYYLDLSADDPYSRKVMLSLNETVSICPVTKSFVDVTFRGYSPLMKGRVDRANLDMYKCTQTERIPLLPSPGTTVIEDWLESDPDVQKLKEDGFWSNYMENVYLGKDVYVAAEHSAQLGRQTLEEYTEQFKGGNPNYPGKLNILNCSTTMEMGVDIGDIEIVFLANVPPAASNYLQRAGRAGRFGQSQAAAFTTCIGSISGMEAFYSPETMLVDTAVKQMPKDSEVVVQRHINSFFFRDFVINDGIRVNVTTTAEDFFFSAAGPSVCDTFIAHLNTLSANMPASFTALFPQRQYQASLQKTIARINEIAGHFNTVYRDLQDAIVILQASNGTQQQIMAAQYQLLRFADQELLSYLSEMQFFPNASMPTGIVEFDASTRADKDKIASLKLRLKKLRAQKRQTPANSTQLPRLKKEIESVRSEISKIEESNIVTRESKVALNEYAPGQTVVVNERNFTSFALQEMDQFGNKPGQMYIQRCSDCGWTVYSPVRPQGGLTPCPRCAGGILGPLLTDDPMAAQDGFTLAQSAVGYRADYNANDDRQESNSKRFYRINAFLPEFSWAGNQRNIGLCDVDGVDDGTIVYTNKGDGHGFAICRDRTSGHYCGHAVVDVMMSQKPAIEHRGHTIKWEKQGSIQVCTTNNVHRHVVLTSETRTSYVALRFFTAHTRTAEMTDIAFLTSMGIVLKMAICRYLAIDENEIAFDINKTDSTNFLFIYDTNRGGAGYASSLTDPQVSEAIFKTALSIVEGFACSCKDEPGHACSRCLVDRGTNSLAAILSTYDVYEWLKRQARQFKEVPQDILAMYPNASYEPRTLREVLTEAATRGDVSYITFFIPKENEMIPSDWCSQNSWIRQVIVTAQNAGKRVHVTIDRDVDDNSPLSLFRIRETVDKLAWLDSVEGNTFSAGPVRPALHLKGQNMDQTFFTKDYDCLPLSNLWGDECDDLYCDFSAPQITQVALPTSNQVQALLNRGDNILLDGLIPDGSYNSSRMFKDIIVPHVIKNDTNTMDTIREILSNRHVTVEYCENYVVSPMACLLLVGLIKEIAERYNLTIDSLSFMLDADGCNGYSWYDFAFIKKAFESNTERDRFLKDLCNEEFEVSPVISTNQNDHYRWLRFRTGDGSTVEIRPDHGISGGWHSPLKYKDLDGLSRPVPFSKNKSQDRPEESILYYVSIKKA